MIDETALSKGQLRKLNALRRSIGPVLADEAFAKWLSQQAEASEPDRQGEIIADALWTLIQEGKLTIPRGGYVVRRGRRRVIVEPCQD
ncbi:MAG: hypothetical protein OXN81_10325 [Alphaproteobacteria bacterium]|nr:hypothetical protein [Alphaproteobacteria bacterium]